MKYTCLLDVYSYSIDFLFYFLYFFLIAVVINFACFEKKQHIVYNCFLYLFIFLVFVVYFVEISVVVFCFI